MYSYINFQKVIFYGERIDFFFVGLFLMVPFLNVFFAGDVMTLYKFC